MQYTQTNRFISIDTPLGKDALLLQGFTGDEGMSRLFRWHLDLLSEEPAIPFDQIIGQRVTITMVLADGSARYINGFVSRFAQRGSDERFTSYYAEVVPWLWFLTRTADCRIFQNRTVPDIITQIFRDLGFSDFQNSLEGSFERQDYCVQYRETDCNFVCRLMEQYGIFFFFAHDKERHTLVLANAPATHQPCPGQPQARYDYSAGARLEEDIITVWQMEQELRAGKYALTDYNFETPSASLMAKTVSTVQVGNNGKYELYDYPGDYLKKAQGERLVRLRMEEEETSHFVAQGSSTCRALTPGYRFDLAGHACQTMNASYVLTAVQHTATVGDSYSGGRAVGEESYANHFTCIPRDTPYRPSRITPKPLVQGPQTAVVVGPPGEEIYTDKYGRVKVQFHWDREGKQNESSSCWIRVSQPWAGKGWGAVAIPRIGQEVIIDFLEGDPDQPIITGRVYNAEQMPPYALPVNQTQTGIKTRSSKGGGTDNFNEIRFEDKKGSEELYIHAEKDENIVVEHDQSLVVGRDKSEQVGRNKTIRVDGNHTEQIAGAMTISVESSLTESVAINYAETVGMAMELTVGAALAITVGAAMAETIGAAKTESIGGLKSENIGDSKTLIVGKNLSETVRDNRNVRIGKDLMENVEGNHREEIKKEYRLQAKKIQIVAEDEINIKAGKAEIVMKKNGDITIKGKQINIKGSGNVIVKGSKIAEN